MRFSRTLLLATLATAPLAALSAQAARLLRQPTISARHIAFTYGADVWIVERSGGAARRLTSTAAVESDPQLSPDGTRIAFTSNRSGTEAVYVMPIEGGTPTRLTYYPGQNLVRGWSPDGRHVLFASDRESAPTGYTRLWTVPAAGGPSTRLPAPMGWNGAYSPDGRRMIVDRMDRWDVEFRSYRGGQNTPLVILDLTSLDEIRLPNERTTDIEPTWLGDKIYFVSDRDWAANVWSYDVATRQVQQVTRFRDAEVKSLASGGGALVFEQDGYLHTLDPATGRSARVEISIAGDFPWAETRWQDVTSRATNVSLSPTGQRVLLEARGEIFTVPAERGATRNLTRSSGTADRAPIWSPDGKQIAWFSDSDAGYRLVIGAQDGTGERREISIGESKMAWEPAWSPDGSRIAFVDDDTRIRVVELASGRVTTADHDGSNIGRGDMGLVWSPDSKWLAYAKYFPNNFRRIVVWSLADGKATPVTDAMANAVSPSWDRGGRHLYFLASTDLALGSGWANTSSVTSRATYGVYVTVLRADDPTPFPPKSDEEAAPPPPKPDTGAVVVRVDFAGIDRRTLALGMPVRDYQGTLAGPKGTVFIAEAVPQQQGVTVHKYTLADAKSESFATGISFASVSHDAKKILLRSGSSWRIVGTDRPPAAGSGTVTVALRMELDRAAEWQQMFDEAWRYERDYFYDPAMHGADWSAVRARYRPLVAHVRHRSDLNYILDMMNGELAVGHSFVFGGDMPAVDTVRVGLLGADFAADRGRWRIARIYTFESWNPGLSAPLDRPGTRLRTGHYLVGVDGVELTAADDPYRLLDGTAGRQTVLHFNERPEFAGAWTETVEPIRTEGALRQRAWVEDNRRRVDSLSSGRLAYAWIPNTGGGGVVSFNRYVFAQQDREGAVIDERFNGGGSLDDYMVDYLTRTLRGAITNHVPNGAPFKLPQGVLGPKVLLINELAGSGGDYFPWAFRQQQAGPLIGMRTWGGLVKSSVHYSLVDGGALTAPDNAVFDPLNNRWVAENEGVPPDIEVWVDAKSAAAGRDPQLERGVQEALRLLQERPTPRVVAPPFSRPARRP